jgi:hypothetical protein
LEDLGFLLLCLKETALGKWVGGGRRGLMYFVTKSCGKQNLVKLFKKGFGIAIIYLFVVFGLFSKSWDSIYWKYVT